MKGQIARVRKHQQRGEVGAQWVRDRTQERRPWMRQVLRSWASVCVGGARLGPDERVYTDDEWRAMRSTETTAARTRRRNQEAVRRLVNFGKVVWVTDRRRAFLREKLRRATLRVRSGVTARRLWRSAGGRVARLVGEAARGRVGARATARVGTMVATVLSLMRARADKRRTGATSGPVRPRLLNAAAMGPVVLDVVGDYESLGFG